MRWNSPRRGDTKIKKKFATLPIEINNEVRWLEWVIVKYQFFIHDLVRLNGKYHYVTGWLPVEFIDN